MESDTPEIGIPVAAGIPDPSEDWSSASLDEQGSPAASMPSEEELTIEEMLAELDSPASSSNSDSDDGPQSDFLDLGGGDAEVDTEEADLEEYTKNALADAPMWDDDEPESPVTPVQPEEVQETPLDDLAADETDASSGDEDFASDLDALLGMDEEADQPASGDLGAALPSLKPDELASPVDDGESDLDDEMSSFLAELETTEPSEVESADAEAGDDLDSLLAQEVDKAAIDGQQLDSTLGGADLAGSLEGAFDEGTGIDDLLATDSLAELAPETPSDTSQGFEALPAMDDFGDFLPEEGGLTPEAPKQATPALDELAGFDDIDLGFGAGVPVPMRAAAEGISDDDLDLTDEDIQRIRKRLLILTPRLREVASRAISEDRISPQSQNKLVRMLLNKAPLDEIREFLEKETGEDLSESEESSEIAVADFGEYESIPQQPRQASSGGRMLANAWPILRVAMLGVGVIILGMLLYLLLIRPGMSGSALMERGLASLDKEEYVNAEDYFRRGEAYLGKEIEWYRRYGNAYRIKKEYGRAVKKIKDGLAFSSNDFESLMLLGDTYTEARDFDSARATFGTLAKLYPKSLKVPEKMGDLHIAIGDDSNNPAQYEMARAEYQKIIDADWENLDGQFKTMHAYIKMRKLPQANEKYKQITKINNRAMHVKIMTEYAALLQNNKQWFDSKTILDKVFKDHWEHAPAHFYMSRYWREQLNQSKALSYLKHATRIDRNNAVYHNETGEVYLELAKPEIAEATRSFTTARELDPEYPKPYINLGNIYYEHLTPGDSGDLNLEEQNYQQALENYENALRRMPEGFTDPKFFYSLGWLHYRKGRYEDAVTAWQRIYVENPFHPIVSFAMGNAWLHLNKDVLASAEYEKVSRYYETISKRIPTIDPFIKRHQNVFGMLVNTYNNIGVSWEMRHQRTGDAEWEKKL